MLELKPTSQSADKLAASISGKPGIVSVDFSRRPVDDSSAIDRLEYLVV